MSLDTAYVKAKNAYDSATSTADHFEVELESANEEATKVSEGIFEANDVNFSLNQLRDRLASIDNRIDEVVLQAKSPLPVVIDRIPAPPIRPASSSTAKLRLIVFVFSFGLVGGVCLLFDFVDDRIRSREELSAAIGGSGCEPIPALGDAEEACFATVVRDSPSSPAAMAIRDLALRIVLEMERADAHIIAFAPACACSGNTTLALNVARVVSARGFKVLVAELPGKSPGLARAAGLPGGKVPPSPWEHKQVDPESAVELMPWVREVGEPGTCLPLNAFFEKARSAYDCIILDMPSPIDSDISQEAIAKSDVVVLVARQEQTAYRDVRRAVELAAATGVPAVTGVLTFGRTETLPLQAGDLMDHAMTTLSAVHKVFLKWIAARCRKVVERFGQLRKLRANRTRISAKMEKPPVTTGEDKQDS